MRSLVLAALVACGSAPSPSPAAPSPSYRDHPTPPPRAPVASAIVATQRSRAELDDAANVPQRAIIVTQQGLGSGRRVVIDLATGALTIDGTSVNEPFHRTATLTAAQLAELDKLVTATRAETPHGDVALYASDSFEHLDLVDGEHVFSLEGHPINVYDGPTDRPAAARLMMAIHDMTR